MADIRITEGELRDPSIDEVINLEKSLTRSGGEFVEDVKTPLHLNPIFYYALAAFVGAFIVWAITEPFYSDKDESGIPFVSDYLLFGPVAGVMGLTIGLTYGIANRNARQAMYCGVVGVGVGLGATIVTTFIADLLFMVTSSVAVGLAGDIQTLPEGEFPFKGVAFFVFMCGRGLAWAVVSMGAGLGLGVALKSKKLTLNGIAGGLVGGLLGGLLFDVIGRFVPGAQEEAWLSRCVGISSVGLLVGAFVGLFENISRDAWLLMVRGPLAGKQFNLFKSPMVLGSAPKCDVYLFKDALVEPHHATVTKSGSKYVLADNGSKSGTLVNGRKIDRYVLQPGDVVAVGETVLKYHERVRQ